MKILFAGDFSVQDRAKYVFQDKQNAMNALSEISSICTKHDLCIVNFESPVTEYCNSILKDGPKLKNPKVSISVLKETGFNLFTLANNHLKDYGTKGVMDTIEACLEVGVKTIGAGANIVEARKSYIWECEGKRIAFFNVCENESSIASDNEPGAAPIKEINLFYDINDAKKNADNVVVIIHGGREHYQLPTPRMKELYHYIADLGADLIVNHHQHCFSGYEVYKGVPIFYGLGNFYFDNPSKRNCIWNQGLMLSVSLGNSVTWELIPIEQCDTDAVIKILPYEDIKQKEEELNAIISNDESLKQAYRAMIEKAHPLSPMQPYTTHYVRALYHRGFLPNLISMQKQTEILNAVRCETHRDVLITYLENLMKKTNN